MSEHPFVAHTDAGDIRGVQSGEGFPLLFLHGGPGLTDYMGDIGNTPACELALTVNLTPLQG
jgi:hypothetical protein